MSSWKKYTLGELLTFENGSSLPRNQLVEQGDGYCLHYGDIHLNGDLNYFDVARDSSWLPMVNLEEMKKYSELYTGDIVFADASEDYEGIGKSVTIVNETDMPFIPGLHTIVGRSKTDGLDLEYKKYFLKSQKVRKQFRRVAAGSSVFGVNSYEIAKFTVEIPESKEEQNKIGCILSSVDEQITQMADKIEYYTELKKALAKKLLTEGIGHTEFKDSEVGKIPAEWEVVTMSDICTINQGLQIAISDRYKSFADGRLPYITIQFLNNHENEDDTYYIEDYQESVVCHPEDILMTRTGNTGMVITGVDGVFHNNFFKVNYDRAKISKDYLVYQLSSDTYHKLILRLAGTTSIPDLKHGDFYKIKIAIPPIEEQIQIGSMINSFEICISQYQNQHTDLTQLKEALMQQLLTGKVRVTI